MQKSNKRDRCVRENRLFLDIFEEENSKQNFHMPYMHGFMFRLVQILLEKSYKLNQFKEAHNTQTQGDQEVFFSSSVQLQGDLWEVTIVILL